MKITSKLKRILCSLLCLCMVLGVVFTMTSCGDKDGDDTDGDDLGGEPTEQVEKTAVIRFVDNFKKGTKITEENIEVVELPATDIPLNAITDKTKVVDKYITVPVYKGEFVFAGKLSTKAPAKTEEKEKTEDYLLISDYAEIGKDVTSALQQLIAKNPGRTIYFPDGKYILSKPIEIPADPAKKVSLRLSSYTTLVASPSWSGDAMIKLGTGEAVANDSTSAYVTGGTLDGNKKDVIAISVVGGRDMFISDVTIKNAKCGIQIAAGRAYTDVENVYISGTGDASTGINVIGEGNTFTSMRITNVGTGVAASGVNNTFRSIFAIYTGTDNTCKAFNDTSKGNNYDGCTSLDFANGFCMGESTVSVYVNCFARWEAGNVTKQYAFVSSGKMNSVIRTCTVKVSGGDSAFVKASTGGTGQVLYPVIYGNPSDTTYTSYLQSGLQVKK